MQYQMLEGRSCFVPESAAEENLVLQVLSEVVELDAQGVQIVGTHLREGPWYLGTASLPHLRSVQFKAIEPAARHTTIFDRSGFPLRLLKLRLALPCDFDEKPQYVCRLSGKMRKDDLGYFVRLIAKATGQSDFTEAALDEQLCVRYLQAIGRYVGFVRRVRTEDRDYIRFVRSSGEVALELPKSKPQIRHKELER